jgi:hypothetical protein
MRIARLDVIDPNSENSEQAYFDLEAVAPVYQFSIALVAGVYLLYSPGPGAVVATHNSLFGEYTSEPTETLEYVVSMAIASRDYPSGKTPRPSLPLPVEREEKLRQIAIAAGAFNRGHVSWRTLLYHIAQGTVEVRPTAATYFSPLE